MIPLDEALRPTWLFGQTVHEGCDRGGYYEQAEFAEEYGSRTCIVKLGCWGPVVQCNVGKRGWMGGIGGCPNVGGICIGCTMPGFPDKFMPFMNQPPGSLLSSSAVMTYGRAIHALRRFTQASLNKEPAWRKRPAPRTSKDSRSSIHGIRRHISDGPSRGRLAGGPDNIAEAESILEDLATVFFQTSSSPGNAPRDRSTLPNMDARYKILLDQIPAVVFMAYLDQGIGEAYVSPQIEKLLGFSQKEWLEDPVSWYRQIHPDDKARWSMEAAGMFLSGKAAAVVVSGDGARRTRGVVSMRSQTGAARRRQTLVHSRRRFRHHGTEEKQSRRWQEERNVVSAIFDTVGALVIVLDRQGRIVRFNRACEQTTGYSFEEVKGRRVREVFMIPEELERFSSIFDQLRNGVLPNDYESYWLTKSGERRLISWSGTVLTDNDGNVTHIIASGIDVTERKRLEKAVLEISAREQRRIGQDLHDGLGQHLTGVAFMGKVLEDRLAEASLAEAAEAAKIVRLVNESIKMTRELARGLLPVVSEAHGLMSALERWAGRGERAVSRRLPLRVPRAGPGPRRDSGRSSLSAGAGSGNQRDQARTRREHHDRARPS